MSEPKAAQKSEQQKVKPGTIGYINGIIFILVVLSGLFLHFSIQLYNWLMALVLLGAIFYFSKKAKPLIGPSIFFLMAFFTTMLPIPFVRLGLFFIIPLAIYAVLFRIFPALKKRSRWFYIGSTDKYTWLGGLAVAIVSSISLYIWAAITKPNLSDLLSLIPHQTLGTLIVVGIGFALLNSIVEESIYRGILWYSFGKIFGSVVAVILLQAAIFGIAHIQGFPRGAIGVAMAFIYGIFLGVIRHRSKGLLAPIIIHIIADLTLYFILLNMMGKI
jgi:uncharacterized protein